MLKLIQEASPAYLHGSNSKEEGFFVEAFSAHSKKISSIPVWK